ncbi:hypothetical protein [Lysinibacter sp. HNR]|uniref:hypothetical protein n=1 Tax=Lysinibacter sp. HNR TaxID=3031408 RepID=UPI0024348460|nr:hypothetical protein [Lysinibacter sp. HNR]WGD37019.1 hypothetical protein FrondiHNR_11315 [Lysinibacter sp. HNR]
MKKRLKAAAVGVSLVCGTIFAAPAAAQVETLPQTSTVVEHPTASPYAVVISRAADVSIWSFLFGGTLELKVSGVAGVGAKQFNGGFGGMGVGGGYVHGTLSSYYGFDYLYQNTHSYTVVATTTTTIVEFFGPSPLSGEAGKSRMIGKFHAAEGIAIAGIFKGNGGHWKDR